MKQVKSTGRWTRRDTLKLAVAAGAGWMAGRVGAVHAAGPMLRRKIPSSGEAIPVVGLGTSDAFETTPGQDLEPLKEVLRRFVALGGSLVDTAAVYGNAEETIGRLVRELGIGDKLFLATKVTTHGEMAGIDQMTNSERLLGKSPLDLIQVHNFVDIETQLKTLKTWKEAGRVRYIGITHYRVAAFDELERYMRRERLDFVQFNYSVVTPDAEERLLPLAAERGMAVLINRAFEDGRLFGAVKGKPLPDWAAEFDCHSWAQFFLKYTLGHPAVTCVIPATSKPKHLIDNMGAGTGRLPDETMRKRMREYMAAL